MRAPQNTRSRSTWNIWMAVAVNCLISAILLALLAFVLISESGCTSTVTPALVGAKEASFDGNAQNSGFLGYNADGSGRISAGARDRYNALVVVYGRAFIPPIKPNDGISAIPDGSYRIDAQHLVYFAEMAAKRRSGIAP